MMLQSTSHCLSFLWLCTYCTVRSESRYALRLRFIVIAHARTHARTHNELKTAITAYIRNISQADIQKVFANKIKRVQACTDARGHHFQTSNTFHKCTATFRTHCIYLWTKRRPRTYVIFYMSHYSEQDRRRTSPAWGKRFFSSPRRPDGLWSLSSFLFNA